MEYGQVHLVKFRIYEMGHKHEVSNNIKWQMAQLSLRMRDSNQCIQSIQSIRQ